MFNGQLGGFSLLDPFIICFFGCHCTLGALDVYYEGELFCSLSTWGVVIQSQQTEGDRGKLTRCYGLNVFFRICKSLELHPDTHKCDLPPWPKRWSWYLVCPELSWEQQWSLEAGSATSEQEWREAGSELETVVL